MISKKRLLYHAEPLTAQEISEFFLFNSLHNL